jgi:hypothetical protein
MNELNKHFLQKICKSEHSVGVHVRRGDMTKEGYYWRVLSPEYYIKAMELFPNSTFYFFSDDMNWVEKNIICCVPHLQCEKVDCNTDDQGYLDLALLVNCRGFICSSGSLGKFGALLAVKPPERVVVPEGTEQIWIDTLDNCMML